MVNELVIIHVVGGIVDTVKILKRSVDASEDAFLDAAIEKAQEIVKKGTDSFDSESDDCRIFAADEDGESHEVWSYGAGVEDHGEDEDE